VRGNSRRCKRRHERSRSGQPGNVRAKIKAGLRELDAGEGTELDIEEFMREAGTEDDDG
jgi:hypothetical protein